MHVILSVSFFTGQQTAGDHPSVRVSVRIQRVWQCASNQLDTACLGPATWRALQHTARLSGHDPCPLHVTGKRNCV